jgi:arsenate reductase
MKPLFVQYPKCGTCQKTAKWLKENGLEVDSRDITIENPTRDELKTWIARSGKSIQKFFNTSGLVYKELNLKEKVKTATEEELLDLLASNGKLVKRPVLVSEQAVLVGFREDEWKTALL